MEIFGFCDASAVIYAKTYDDQRCPQISLISAKSKVAPLKDKLTIPKLELKGALHSN
jgi:Pao retrotransposon peptidase